MTEFPKFKLKDNAPAFYDTDSVTILEVASKLYGKMNEIIQEFNNLSEALNEQMEAFKASEHQDIETFKVAIRQEFQDFIDTVDLKMKEGGVNGN